MLAALAALALGCTGTTTQTYCPTVDATGGSVVGTWETRAGQTQFCVAPYDRVSSGDWCSQLVFDSSGIRSLMLGHPQMNFVSGTIAFTDPNGQLTDVTSGSYTSDLQFEGKDSVWFPRPCIDAYGHVPPATCDDLTSNIGQFLSDGSSANQSFRNLPISQFPNYPPGTVPQATYTTGDCEIDPRGGCTCPYSVGLDVPDKGQWGVDGAGTLTLFSETSAPPYINDYGAGNGSLAISGHLGVDLLGQTGLRMLTFAKK
jgi:hypothetical protein